MRNTESTHLATLQALTTVGGPIDTEAPTATHQQSQNYQNGRVTSSRALLHREIITDFFAENDAVMRDRQALVLAGPPGAGKSSALAARIPAAEEKHWRFIDPDEFKARLLGKLHERGEYDTIVPPAVRVRSAMGRRFAPGELAALVHEESSDLAKAAALVSLSRGERVVLDGVHGSSSKLMGRFNQLAREGYSSVEVIAVDGPRDVTRARVIHRWEGNYQAFVNGATADAAYKARYVPEHITDSLYRHDQRFSACTPAVAEAVRQAPAGLDVSAKVYYVDSPAASGEPWLTFRKNDEAGYEQQTLREITKPQPRRPSDPRAPLSRPSKPSVLPSAAATSRARSDNAPQLPGA